MSYDPLTDFLGLLRQNGSAVEFARMPGLDYVVSAMARAGFFRLSVGQTAPTANQATTVWLKPSLPSWVAEGTVFLWNASTAVYELATPLLWNVLLSPAGYLFQSAIAVTNAINTGATVVAVQRAAPDATGLVLPKLTDQWLTGRPIKIVDWSTAVVNHAITITTPDGSTIMRLASLQLLSNAVQLAGVTLHPVPELNGWIIAP
jgi:hypothetical protein